MNTPKLPPLPEPSWPFGCKYNEKDMQAYAIAAIKTQGVPDVDALAQFIREIDGKHDMGAGALAERICAWLASAPQAPQAEELALWKARALQAEAIVSKFMEPQPLSETNPLNYDSSPTDEGCAALYRAHGIKE